MRRLRVNVVCAFAGAIGCSVASPADSPHDTDFATSGGDVAQTGASEPEDASTDGGSTGFDPPTDGGTTADPDATDTAGTSTGDSSGGSAAACGPSDGVGGEAGLQSVAAPAFVDVPGVLYVPPDYHPDEALPLLIALHGAGDTAENFAAWWQDTAEQQRFVLLVPESMAGGVSWNPGNDTPVIAALIDHVAERFNVDGCRTYLTGYSAGAHMTYILGLLGADSFAALGIMSGSMHYAEQGGIWPDAVTRPIPVSIHHGIDDPVVPFSHAEHARDELEGAGHPVDFHTHENGHGLVVQDQVSMWNDIGEHRLDE